MRLCVFFAASWPIMNTPDGWAFVNKTDTLQYTLPERHRWDDFGINQWEVFNSKNDFEKLSEEKCQVVRLICGAASAWNDSQIEEMKKTVQNNLLWARQTKLKIGMEMHGLWFPEGLVGEKGYSDPKKIDELIRRWKLIIEWCKPFKDVIVWYDLLNEPSICYEKESVKPYAVAMRKMVAALRPLVGDTPFLVECVNGSNQVGLLFWEDLGDNNIICGYHDYWPHMFTHQRVVEPGDMSMPASFYGYNFINALPEIDIIRDYFCSGEY